MKKILLLILIFVSVNTFAAKKDSTVIDSFKFTPIKENKITSIKNQARSGTCWSFSTIALLESELLREGKPATNLSEMFVVHHTYTDKAEHYVRLHGKTNFGAGGSFYDVLYVLKNYGMVPDSIMTGLDYGEKKHRQAELDALTKAYVDVIVSDPNKRLSTAWKKGFEGILDAYLGKIPKDFKVNGKEYTPMTYAKSLGLNADDYVSLTSFTHHPYYTQFAIEVPDNWRNALSYNLPLDKFMEVFDYAINHGYCIAWGADVSEKGFSFKKGVAVDPIVNVDSMPKAEQEKWIGVPQKEMETKIYKLQGPQPEIKVTPKLRQRGYDDYETTDDHGMEIFGIAKDQNGTKYYMVKNSWGTDNKYKGIWYASETYVRHKTMNIVVNKNAIPKEIRKKLGIK